MSGSAAPWWRGTRGEWYVVAQFALFALVAFGPRELPGWPGWPAPGAWIGSVAGAILMPLGLALVLAGAVTVGRGISPLPHPREGAPLRESGPFRLVRHPMYGGGIMVAFGWALWNQAWPTLAYAALLAILLDLKARREERWLRERFPEYEAYRRRVRRLVPFVY